jgi:hypothetical protein
MSFIVYLRLFGAVGTAPGIIGPLPSSPTIGAAGGIGTGVDGVMVVTGTATLLILYAALSLGLNCSVSARLFNALFAGARGPAAGSISSSHMPQL